MRTAETHDNTDKREGRPDATSSVSSELDWPVVGLGDVERASVQAVGGKGATLAKLSKVEGLRVPDGFCVTTAAFRRIVASLPAIDADLDQLAHLVPDDVEDLGEVAARVRRAIEHARVPEDLAEAISGAVIDWGESAAYAVRSSGTAEDLPSASFAGQHDTYLNVVGVPAILEHVRRCWASLFSERAVAYRTRSGIDHRQVAMAVIVQHMVRPRASGVLFTADPVTGNRKVATVEAVFGLGEALVSGTESADACRVRDGEVVERSVATKRVAIHAASEGGTVMEPLEPTRQAEPVLSDEELLALVELGRRIEAHFGTPQDIEWCLVDAFEVVQSRPITMLFPIPPASDDANHVYVSVGHNQMMTDATKPLGLSVWQMTTPAPMSEAGGRLFVDVTARLAAPSSRADFLELSGKTDPLVRDGLQTVLDRENFIPSLPDDGPAPPPAVGATVQLDADPAIVSELIDQSEVSIAACRRDIETKSGAELLDFILSDMQELRRLLFDPRSRQVFMTAIEATWWINQHLLDWLGERNVADTLTQSVPHNVTSEMGLALLNVADAIRPYPDMVAFLRGVDDDGFLDELDGFDGGPDVRAAVKGFLDKYGMRCAGEIDITRPRWSEHPTALLPLILAHVKNMEPGEAQRRFDERRREASTKERELLERLSTLPDGDEKAAQTTQMIDRVRTFIGYREYPKYGMVRRYFIYKQALLAEAERLVEKGVLREKEDIFYLRFEELHDVVRTNHVDEELVDQRKDAFRSYQALTPPRVLTSDGEAVAGAFRRDDVPSGALAGLAVSGGTIEGRARVVLDIGDADLEPGDILVTTYTDPSWTPLFICAAGLVTEVGGMMTHGAVIAREYGLPAVVGVDHATRRIEGGQRIRVDGTRGYVEILTP
ncbi:MAG: phosphoenolpyruvate synthase [Acidimicrobiia bacterium]|nr:phosphoenolpyruvate synthase [Acidimicrobiia bacterium]